VHALRREWGTHLHAADVGWEFPVTYGEAMSALLTRGYLTVHHDPKQPKADLPMPWGGSAVTFTPEEIEAAEQALKRRSAIRD